MHGAWSWDGAQGCGRQAHACETWLTLQSLPGRADAGGGGRTSRRGRRCGHDAGRARGGAGGPNKARVGTGRGSHVQGGPSRSHMGWHVRLTVPCICRLQGRIGVRAVAFRCRQVRGARAAVGQAQPRVRDGRAAVSGAAQLTHGIWRLKRSRGSRSPESEGCAAALTRPACAGAGRLQTMPQGWSFVGTSKAFGAKRGPVL